MEFLAGVLLTLCIVLIAALIYLLKHPNVKTKHVELSEEEKKEQKRVHEHVNKMMNYNADQAYGGR